MKKWQNQILEATKNEPLADVFKRKQKTNIMKNCITLFDSKLVKEFFKRNSIKFNKTAFTNEWSIEEKQCSEIIYWREVDIKMYLILDCPIDEVKANAKHFDNLCLEVSPKVCEADVVKRFECQL